MNDLSGCTRGQEPASCLPTMFGDFELACEFQPIVSPTHRRTIGLEALARPRRDNQAVSPAVLFAEATADDSEPSLDLALWEHALQIYARDRPNAWLFLNLSAASVVDPRTAPATLAHLVHQSGLACDRIVLEIVEDAVNDQAALARFVAGCRTHGFRIAIDDFGAGDAHFERIWRIRPDIVKMDRTMVVHAAENPRASRLFMSLIRMIRENGSLVLVEGLETREQAALAWESEADFYQGFWYSHPHAALEAASAEAEPRLFQARKHFDALNGQQESEQIQRLRSLRHEVLETCHRVAGGDSLAEAATHLLEYEGGKRCYLLDTMGVQQGPTASATGYESTGSTFNPLLSAEGASWSHREYFRNAVNKPGEIHLSRPYVALPDTARTVTVSHMTYTLHGYRILCLDIHPEQAFPGSHHQLPHHI
ncbi:MAG: sensor domain-containing phosphodiesterase [Pseudomonadota bacterium]